MYFDSLSAVLTMDGHGAYVWSAADISRLGRGLVVGAPLRRLRDFLRLGAGEQKRLRQGPTAKTEVN